MTSFVKADHQLLSWVTLRTHSSQFASIRDFYVGVLGMSEIESNDPVSKCQFRFAESTQSCGVEFVANDLVSKAYTPSRGDIYWKIGINLHDVNSVATKLASQGVSSSKPAQFLDIGFLCHIADRPNGFCIELLQTSFETNRELRQQFINENNGEWSDSIRDERDRYPLLQKAPVIGQITMRITNPEKSLEFYRNVLGMKLLSIQPVDRYGFTLYFLAFTDESPPNPHQLESVDNREWCWQRPYTLLELQHCVGANSLRNTLDEEVGFQSFTVSVIRSKVSTDAQEEVAETGSSAVTEADLQKNMDPVSTFITDPDGCKIVFEYAYV